MRSLHGWISLLQDFCLKSVYPRKSIVLVTSWREHGSKRWRELTTAIPVTDLKINFRKKAKEDTKMRKVEDKGDKMTFWNCKQDKNSHNRGYNIMRKHIKIYLCIFNKKTKTGGKEKYYVRKCVLIFACRRCKTL